HLERQLAVGEHGAELRPPLRPAGAGSSRRPARATSAGAAGELAMAREPRPPEAPPHAAAAPEVRGLRLADAARALHARPLRRERERIASPRRLLVPVHVAALQLRVGSRRFAALLILRAAR